MFEDLKFSDQALKDSLRKVLLHWSRNCLWVAIYPFWSLLVVWEGYALLLFVSFLLAFWCCLILPIYQGCNPDASNDEEE